MNVGMAGSRARSVAASAVAIGLALGAGSAWAKIDDPYTHIIQDGDFIENADGYVADKAYSQRYFEDEDGTKSVHPQGGWGSLAEGDFNGPYTIAFSGVFPTYTGTVARYYGGVIATFGSVGTWGGYPYNSALGFVTADAAHHIKCLLFQRYNSGNRANDNSSYRRDITVSPFGYHTIVVTRSGYDLKYYVDGVLSQSVTYPTGANVFPNTIQIGAIAGGHFGNNSPYTPLSTDPRLQFKDMRIFKRALSDEEVAEYAAAFPARADLSAVVSANQNWSAIAGTEPLSTARLNVDADSAITFDQTVTVTNALRFLPGNATTALLDRLSGYEDQPNIGNVVVTNGFTLSMRPGFRFGGKVTVADTDSHIVLNTAGFAITNDMALLTAEGGLTHPAADSITLNEGDVGLYYDPDGKTVRCTLSPVEFTLGAPSLEDGQVVMPVDIQSLGSRGTYADLRAEWATNFEFTVVAGSADLGRVTSVGQSDVVVPGVGAGSWYFRVTAVNGLQMSSTAATYTPLKVGITDLTEDTDWTAHEWKSGETVNLNGYRLAIAVPDCPIIITGVKEGSALTIDVADGQESATDNVTMTGSYPLYKTGAGTLVLSKESVRTGDTVVSNGVVKAGIEGALAEGNRVCVEKGGAFDVNGIGQAGIGFVIAGEGPDGKGALRNTGADIASGVAQMLSLALTDDALVCADGSFGLVAASTIATTLELNGHTLTVDYAADKVFWLGKTSGETAGTVRVISGSATFCNGNSNLLPADFVADGTNAAVRLPGGNNVRVHNLTLTNGGLCENRQARGWNVDSVYILGSGSFDTTLAWFYVSDKVVVSNETEAVTLTPTFHEFDGSGAFPVVGSYPKLIKYGAGTLTVASVHNQNRFANGVEIHGGKVVLAGGNPVWALNGAGGRMSPIAMDAGTVLDVTACGTAAIDRQSTLVAGAGARIDGTAENVITLTGEATLGPGFSFPGKLTAKNGDVTIPVEDPAAASKATLLDLAEDTILAIKKLTVAFGKTPVATRFTVCETSTMTEEQAAAITLKVLDPDGGILPDWSLRISDGKLKLIAPRSDGFMIIVR